MNWLTENMAGWLVGWLVFSSNVVRGANSNACGCRGLLWVSTIKHAVPFLRT